MSGAPDLFPVARWRHPALAYLQKQIPPFHHQSRDRRPRVARQGNDVVIALDDGPSVNFCKPAVDPLFISATEVWQGGVMALVLTGMGSDGMRGGREIVAAGGSVIAQDEASSVVWGMPGAAANAGICAAVMPLDQIAPKLVRLFSGDRS